MDEGSPSLGQVIREVREAQVPKLSQEELGRRAGYRAGAGVSISRIENGITRPGPRRLKAIAEVLGVTADDLLERRVPTPAASPDTPSVHDGESTSRRMRRLQAALDARHDEAVAAAAAFNRAHDRARDDFFLAFLAAAATIEGLPARDLGDPATQSPSGTAASEARLRRRLAVRGISASLHATTAPGSTASRGLLDDSVPTDPEAAYAEVVATAILGSTANPAPTHAPEATARATRALLGSGTRTTGLVAGALLTGLLATAASPLLAAASLIWMARRSRRQNDALRQELDRAEAGLAASEHGFRTVLHLLDRATRDLDYIAVHGGHAHQRWLVMLPATPRCWADLTPQQQAQFDAFVELAACQICVDSIDMTELLGAPSPRQEAGLQVADQLLTLSRQDIERLV